MLCELLDTQLAPGQQLSGWSLKKQSTAPRLSTLRPLHHQFPSSLVAMILSACTKKAHKAEHAEVPIISKRMES